MNECLVFNPGKKPCILSIYRKGGEICGEGFFFFTCESRCVYLQLYRWLILIKEGVFFFFFFSFIKGVSGFIWLGEKSLGGVTKRGLFVFRA
jgi:hypothetical protein